MTNGLSIALRPVTREVRHLRELASDSSFLNLMTEADRSSIVRLCKEVNELVRAFTLKRLVSEKKLCLLVDPYESRGVDSILEALQVMGVNPLLEPEECEASLTEPWEQGGRFNDRFTPRIREKSVGARSIQGVVTPWASSQHGPNHD